MSEPARRPDARVISLDQGTNSNICDIAPYRECGEMKASCQSQPLNSLHEVEFKLFYISELPTPLPPPSLHGKNSEEPVFLTRKGITNKLLYFTQSPKGVSHRIGQTCYKPASARHRKQSLVSLFFLSLCIKVSLIYLNVKSSAVLHLKRTVYSYTLLLIIRRTSHTPSERFGDRENF